MDLQRFKETYQRLQDQANFTEYDKLIIDGYKPARLVGDFTSVHEHFLPIIDPEKPNAARPFYCGGPTANCPVCKVSIELRAAVGEPKKVEWGEKIRAKERFFFNALDRTPTGREEHAKSKHTKILVQGKNSSSVGSMVFQNIGAVVAMLEQQKPTEPSWADLQNYDLGFSKTGQQMATKYPVNYTGDRTPLTPEELAYQKYDLSELSKHTDRAVMERLAQVMKTCRPLQPSELPGATGGDTSFNPVALEQASKLQSQPQTLQATPVPTPVAAPTPVPTPQPELMQHTVLTRETPAFIDTNMQDTRITNPIDPNKQVPIPCSSCGSMMHVNITDPRPVLCWKCGKIFASPAASKPVA